MKNRNFNNRDNYRNPEEALTHMKLCQEEMIRRRYKDYTEQDYVLWIIPDMFFNYKYTEIEGAIAIIKQDGSIMDIPYIHRNPYPNKAIHQLSMPSGLKRLYGIPLVFQSYEELAEIAEVQITWNIFYDMCLSEKATNPFLIRLDQLIIRYPITFEKSENNRFYTIYTKDTIPEIANISNPDTDIAEEYDIALEYNNNVIFYPEDGMEILRIEAASLKPITSKVEEKEDDIRKYVFNISVPLETAREYLKDEISAFGSAEMNYSQYYYESSATLKPGEVADIDTASCFGFAEI